MQEENQEATKATKCEEFLNGIVHPNEQILAREIMEGKKVGEFSLSFDQAQIDTMTSSLENVGCLESDDVVDGTDSSALGPDVDENDAATDAVAPAGVTKGPVDDGEDMPNQMSEPAHPTGEPIGAPTEETVVPPTAPE